MAAAKRKNADILPQTGEKMNEIAGFCRGLYIGMI
jgi:hypothetical protein